MLNFQSPFDKITTSLFAKKIVYKHILNDLQAKFN